MKRLTNPNHGGIRSMRLPLSNQADIYRRLAAYEDTGLSPGDIKDLQRLCEKNGLAEYVDMIVEAKRLMTKDNERSMEQDAHIEQLEAELTEYRQAKSDGRLVVLPCKIGDKVYALQPKRISDLCVDPLHKEIVVAKVIEITLRQGIKWIRLFAADNRMADFQGDKFGKTVFLTREEAEKH
jgi:DNA-binding transcriptional MerR regulator